MPKLKRISGEETIRRLECLGFQRVRQRGSHVVLKKNTAEGDIGCIEPAIINGRCCPYYMIAPKQ